MSISDSCTKIRRALRRHHSLDMATGVMTDTGYSEWTTGPCNTPLFSDAERTTGLCRACTDGWTHPENYAVEWRVGKVTRPDAGGPLYAPVDGEGTEHGHTPSHDEAAIRRLCAQLNGAVS